FRSIRRPVRSGRPPGHSRLLAAALACFPLALLACGDALGASYKQDRTPLHLSGKSAGGVHSASGGFARLGIGLVVVVAVIFAIYWFVKRANRGGKTPKAGGSLRIVATAPLGP